MVCVVGIINFTTIHFYIKLLDKTVRAIDNTVMVINYINLP